ncbi:unnamed protein product [Phaedon cochleariae]|uniref:Uncharacterized protein n=1 Tax=Phaedon cochleariae TaxID=80249 RepID=A0A9P0GX73_PHACE|nr:unnamed protein product [Phaedon cochleariae]
MVMSTLSYLLLIFIIASSTSAENADNHPQAYTTFSPSKIPKSGKPAGRTEEEPLDEVLYFDDVIVENERSRKDAKMWDHWGKWSPCSVSCGVGKMTRWRHCISKACASGDKEAQIKTCTLSPC